MGGLCGIAMERINQNKGLTVPKFKCFICHEEFPIDYEDDCFWQVCWKCAKKIRIKVDFVECPKCKTMWNVKRFIFSRDGRIICPLCDYTTSHFYVSFSDSAVTLKHGKLTMPELEIELEKLKNFKESISSLLSP